MDGFETGCIQTDFMDLGVLVLDEDKIGNYDDEYGADLWWLIYQTDVRFRSEHVARIFTYNLTDEERAYKPWEAAFYAAWKTGNGGTTSSRSQLSSPSPSALASSSPVATPRLLVAVAIMWLILVLSMLLIMKLWALMRRLAGDLLCGRPSPRRRSRRRPCSESAVLLSSSLVVMFLASLSRQDSVRAVLVTHVLSILVPYMCVNFVAIPAMAAISSLSGAP